jgi:hypothetical protein
MKKMRRDQIKPQEQTNTIRDDYDLLTETELDLFILKVDALNANLDSLQGKQDFKVQEECCETNELARDRILLNYHRHVVRDICMHIRYYRTIRTFRLQRIGRTIESLPSRPQSCSLIHMSAPQHSERQEAEQQTAMTAQELPEEATTPPPLHRHQQSSFTTPASHASTVTPDSAPSTSDHEVEIIEEDNDDILAMTPPTPRERERERERTASPSSLTILNKRVRAGIQTLVDQRPPTDTTNSTETSNPLQSFAPTPMHRLPPERTPVQSRATNETTTPTSTEEPDDTGDYLDSDSSVASRGSSSSSNSSSDSRSSSSSASKDSWQPRSARKSRKSRKTKATLKKSTRENRKKKHFEKVTKLTCGLTKTAVRFHLKVPRPDTNQRTRRDAFLSFKNTVEDVLAQHSETATIMHEHPILPASLPSFVNEAFAAFLNAHMNAAVKNLTSSVERGDGLGLFKRL